MSSQAWGVRISLSKEALSITKTYSSIQPAMVSKYSPWHGRTPRGYDGVGPAIVLLVDDVVVFVLELCSGGGAILKLVLVYWTALGDEDDSSHSAYNGPEVARVLSVPAEIGLHQRHTRW